MILSKLDTTSDEDLAAAFRYAANQVSQLGLRFGFTVRSYDDATLPYFSALPSEARRRVVHALRGYHASLLAGIQADKNFDQPHISTWWAFSTLGLVPVADLFQHFRADSVIEVFSLDGTQIWRNFNFYRFNSYTLEELHCLHWERLYDRGASITAECYGYLERLLSGGPDLVLPTVPEYTLVEKCSRDRYMVKVHHYLLSALKNREGATAAWIICTKSKLIAHDVKETQAPAGQPGAGLLRGHLKLVPSPELDGEGL